MEVVRWTPFCEFETMERRMRPFFEDAGFANVEGTFAEELLEIHVAKPPETKPRKIAIAKR